MHKINIISDQIKNLPKKPGVYQFFNFKGEIIYIGKAKNLYNRVKSYFSSDIKSLKNEILVKNIAYIKYILVESESDAFLLENNLIKEYKPRYNVLLKDDKTFPWICIKNEFFPRVFYTRTYLSDKSDYFGPYTSVVMVKTLLELIRQLYKLRTCNLKLDPIDIVKGKYQKCLEFHLENCKGPCEGLQSSEDYNTSLSEIREILKGNLYQVINHLTILMKRFSNQLLFEEAQIVKHKIDILEKFKAKSTIVNPKISNVDVIYIICEEDKSYVNFFKVINGSIIQAHNLEIINKLQEAKEELLSYIIYNLRKRFNSEAKEIIVPFKPDSLIQGIKITIPKQGDKKKLLDLSRKNVLSFRNDILNERNSQQDNSKSNNILESIKKDLRLKITPDHIECFDISNIQGKINVASCIVYIAGKPKKSEYRHFNIQTVIGANDYASMAEVIYRRYSRMISEQKALPDLIIIDGGKGQLNAALNSIRQLDIGKEIAIISIAKRLEEIYIPNDPVPLYLNKNSPSLRLIQQIRDEAHRFGITFHRSKRSASFITSELLTIPGIGEKSVVKILSTVDSITDLKNMTLTELINLAGKKAGIIIFNHFHKEN